MSGSYVAHVESTASSFSSPNIGASQIGILCQAGGGTTSHGIPTWDGSNMTLAVERNPASAPQGVSSIWYILNPTAGVTTVVRSSGSVTVAWALATLELAQGNIVLDTIATGGFGQGGMLFAEFSPFTEPVDFGVSCVQIANLAGPFVHASGEQTKRDDLVTGGRGYAMGTSEGSPANRHGWDWGGTHDACGVAVAFGGRNTKGSSTIIKL